MTVAIAMVRTEYPRKLAGSGADFLRLHLSSTPVRSGGFYLPIAVLGSGRVPLDKVEGFVKGRDLLSGE
jgi:hypothetical protein